MTAPLRPDAVIVKDPDAEVPYYFDWDEWMNASASIDDYELIIDGPDDGLDLDNDGLTDNERGVQFRIVGGTVGHKYRVTCRIETDETPVVKDVRSVWFVVKDR